MVEFSIHKEMAAAFKFAAKIPEKHTKLNANADGFDTGGFLTGDGHQVDLWVMTGHQYVRAKVAEYTGEKFETFLPPKTMRQIGQGVKKSTPEWLVFKVYGTGMKCSHLEGESLTSFHKEHFDEKQFDTWTDKLELWGAVEYENKDQLISQFSDALKVEQTKYGRIYTWIFKNAKEDADKRIGRVNADYITNLLNFMAAVQKSAHVDIKCYASEKYHYNGQARVFKIKMGGVWAILMSVCY